MPPPARTLPIMALSTLAGCSVFEASAPQPRASKPTASTPQSTSESPRIFLEESRSVGTLRHTETDTACGI